MRRVALFTLRPNTGPCILTGALAVILTLGGCGGGSTDSPTSPGTVNTTSNIPPVSENSANEDPQTEQETGVVPNPDQNTVTDADTGTLHDLDSIDPSQLPLTLEPLEPVVTSVTPIDSANRPPYLDGLTDQVLYAGATMNLRLIPEDPDGGVAGVYVESLPISAVFLDNLDSTRTIRWRPLQPDVGIHTVTVVAGDAQVPTYQTRHTIRLQVILPEDLSTIENLPPRLDQIGDQVVRTGDTIVALVKAVDPNGTHGPILSLNKPSGGTFLPHPERDGIYTLRWTTTAADLGTAILRFRAVDAIDSSKTSDNSLTIRIADPAEFQVPGQRLHELASAQGILFGYASALGYTERPDADLYADKARQEFNLVTTENSIKWGYVNPEPGEWRWDAADNLVAFAKANAMVIHGHPLVWHWQLPKWVQKLPASERRSAMLRFIRTVVNRYNNDVELWDVVNEALESDGSFRRSIWLEAMGEDYISVAFNQARTYAPTAKLLYNDFDVAWINPKSDAMYALVNKLLQEGVSIDGVGFQMHINSDFNQFASTKTNFQRFADLGLDIYITELDVEINAGNSLQQQADVYSEVLGLCLEQPRCRAVQTWGFTDRYSWRDDQTPLIFDREYQPKPAYFSLQERLSTQ